MQLMKAYTTWALDYFRTILFYSITFFLYLVTLSTIVPRDNYILLCTFVCWPEAKICKRVQIQALATPKVAIFILETKLNSS